MNIQSQAVLKKRTREAPLFASPWMALFLLLRREWATPRSRQ
jgi:hypothetical protein